ncbi:hypothetical protein QPK87_00555 [Kamptonema cortianum]|nr:hypothetical protein [Geitlerinema splendidum]MDK3155080.1 hypothetical protein [Kamptonema cortianum]
MFRYNLRSAAAFLTIISILGPNSVYAMEPGEIEANLSSSLTLSRAPLIEPEDEVQSPPSPLSASIPMDFQEQKAGWFGTIYSYTLGPVVSTTAKAGELITDYAVTPAVNAATAAKEYVVTKAQESLEAARVAAKKTRQINEVLENGIDFYPYMKTATTAGQEWWNQPSDFTVPPAAAHFLQGFSEDMMPVIENVLVNAVRLGGANAGAKLLNALGATQLVAEYASNAALNPAAAASVVSKIGLLSKAFKALNISTLIGEHATQGIVSKLQAHLKKEIARKMKIDPNAELLDPSRNVDTFNPKLAFKQTLKQARLDARKNAKTLAFQKAVGFVNRSLERTIPSMIDDMAQVDELGLRPTIDVILYGNDRGRESFERLKEEKKKVSWCEKSVDFAKKYSSPANVIKSITPDVVKTQVNAALEEANLKLGSVVGKVAGEALTEEFITSLQLSKMQLFSPDQLRLNVSQNIQSSESVNENVKNALTYVDDYVRLDNLVAKALQRTGKKASKKVLKVLKEPLAAAFKKAGIHHDINDLMSKKIEPTRAEKVTKKMAGAAIYLAKDTWNVLSNWVMTPSLAAAAEAEQKAAAEAAQNNE